MRRRSFDQQEQADNHDRWLISYADFITLLFAFFVVMYAISSVNDSKYQQISNSLVNAFGSKSIIQSQPSAQTAPPAVIELPIPMEPEPVVDEAKEKRYAKQKKMKRIAKDIMQALAPLVQDGTVRITQSDHGIIVEINASVLFSPGEAQLAKSSDLSLSAVAKVLKGHEHEIHVEGHTDDQPINTTNFPSNWELSTARASRVIRLFIENGVNARRLTALGFGENQPIASNDLPEGQARNRRVTVMIKALEPEQIIEIPIDFNADEDT